MHARGKGSDFLQKRRGDPQKIFCAARGVSLEHPEYDFTKRDNICGVSPTSPLRSSGRSGRCASCGVSGVQDVPGNVRRILSPVVSFAGSRHPAFRPKSPAVDASPQILSPVVSLLRIAPGRRNRRKQRFPPFWARLSAQGSGCTRRAFLRLCVASLA